MIESLYLSYQWVLVTNPKVLIDRNFIFELPMQHLGNPKILVYRKVMPNLCYLVGSTNPKGRYSPDVLYGRQAL